jgi:hypothetical protein
MTQPAVRRTNPVRTHPWISATIALLISGCIVGTLYVPIYASATPKVGDFPFFYFYLLAYMPVVAIALWIVMQLQKRLGVDGTDSGGEGK